MPLVKRYALDEQGASVVGWWKQVPPPMIQISPIKSTTYARSGVAFFNYTYITQFYLQTLFLHIHTFFF
jgi:hypothetical protein